MAKLSVIIPSRDERFLTPTIDDIFAHAAGEIEVVAVLDSDKWPLDWKSVTDRHSNLVTIHNGKSIGMRGSINKGVGSAISRGAKFIMKCDGHCSFSEGFDEILKAECEPNWVVVPRRGRLDPEAWTATETHKPDIDYHYLSFPDDPNDFGGPGLNGKPWLERATERKDILLDDEMSSQGSCWFMHASYFNELELMDEANWGTFWCEFQEIGLRCWLSGGKVMVNKDAKYLHLHKGRKYGRGYRLEESQLQKGRNRAMLWPWNEEWSKQTKPFEWLIDHFWPVPTWSENWREVLYATRKPRAIGVGIGVGTAVHNRYSDPPARSGGAGDSAVQSLKIHKAHYGVGSLKDIDVRDHLQSLVKDNSLDIIVGNSTLTPNSNPFRGKKKQLHITYSIDGGEVVTKTVAEKDWLIIGPVQPPVVETVPVEAIAVVLPDDGGKAYPLLSAKGLNDYLIRRFQISPQRLRGPMPIELRDFHRNDLAQLFAELGFKRGAEIGVAEGNYSEVLLKANPDLHLLCVDPWHSYGDNPQNKSKEKNEYAYNEAKRKLTQPGWHVKLIPAYSMDAVRDVEDNSLDFVYIDGHHSYPYVMCDVIEWTKKVRSGGIVAGDDVYRLNEKWGAGPMEAIYDYARAMKIEPWFLINAHKSVDFFFVKQ